MDFIGGQMNPIIQATKFRKLRRSYIDQMKKSEESIGPSTTIANVSPIGSQSPMISDSAYKRRRKITKPKLRTEFKSANIIGNPNLVIIRSSSQERNLLNLAGLNTEASDYVLTIKDRQGGIKSALSMKIEDDIVHEINYIDVDSDGSNFKKGLVRLATLSDKSFTFNEQLNVTSNKIKDNIVK
jgi:hypothetical protein